MRRILTLCKVLCLSTLLCQQAGISYQAVTIVPVADLVGSALANTRDYATLPLCGGKPKAFSTCKRLHQLLFNEIIEVTLELNGQVEVTLPHLFFVPSDDTTHKMSTYWTLKKNIIPLKDSQLKALVPQPISYVQTLAQQPLVPQANTITLIAPYSAPECDCTFSAGTRFIVTATNPENKTVTVELIHPKTHTPTQIAIPYNYCLTPAATREQQRKNFVKLVRLWAHGSGAIPYVWGGCSYIFSAPNFAFKEITTGTNQSHYVLEPRSPSPHTGFDCAGLVARAAQAAGLPYFFKNTTTLATYLRPITEETPVQDGDLIWIPGHVMIVSDREKNTLIEARDYSSGWGCVQERPLKEVFKNIVSYNDLETRYHNKKALQRIDNSGVITNTYTTFKLLSLNSIWH
jgi:hypothetical protein